MKKETYLAMIEEHEDGISQLEETLRQAAGLYHRLLALGREIYAERYRQAPEPIQPPGEHYEEWIHPMTHKKVRKLVPASLQPRRLKDVYFPPQLKNLSSQVLGRLATLTGAETSGFEIFYTPTPMPEGFKGIYDRLRSDAKEVPDAAV